MYRLIVLFALLVAACDPLPLDNDSHERCKNTCAKHGMKWTGLRTGVDDRLFCECRVYFEAESDKQIAEQETQHE